MLKFIFGYPASGKTHTVLKMIKEATVCGKDAVYIVPEQFSFESERAVLKKLGDKAALNVSVMSFSRLCDEVGRSVGGIAGRVLTGADKVIFMSRALSAAAEDLRLWQGYVNSVYFAETMLDTIGEFKISSVSAEDLRDAAENVRSETLKLKLKDIATVYEAYDTVTGEKFIDPADNLTTLYRQLEKYKYFENKMVFIDSFKGFTGQQFKILDRIFAQAENVVISLTNDIEATTEYNVFENIRGAVLRIRESAARYGVKEDSPLILNKSRAESMSIAALERALAGVPCLESETDGGITVCTAATVSDEAEFAARTIRRLVREKGYRYRDFVIIVRATDIYEESVFSACAQNNIPLFADRREPLSAFPLSVAIASAINTAGNMSTESILRFHKTGLGTLNTDEIALLENYTLLWGVEGELWQENWVMNPRGLVSDAKENDEARLREINRVRKKAIEPLLKFKESFKGNAADMVRAVVALAETCGAADKLRRLSVKFKDEGSEFSSDILKQSYERYMKLLDSIATCFGDKTLKRKEFSEALALAVSLDSVGAIPRMLDEVSFGAADRIRPSRPKVAFILGANQGVFPQRLSSSKILGIGDRAALINLGINIPDNQISSVIDENYLVYSNLTCPSDRLYISYAQNDLSGEAGEPSQFVSLIRDKLAPLEVIEPDSALHVGNLPETAESAYSQYCRRRLSAEGTAEIKAALEGFSEGKKTEYLEKLFDGRPVEISKETADKLFGKSIKMSASKLDTFYKCRFYFFCKYGIGAKKLQPAEFDVLQRGTIVHYVLERAVREYKKDLSLLSREETDLLAEKYTAEYLDGIAGYRAVETERSRFLVTRIVRALKDVLHQLALEFAQSDFEPVSCELKIGNGGDIPELKIPFDGGDISIIGSIDRVDKFGSYIRVVDYKTGSKSFKLPDVLYGLNLQMLIYLYALVRGENLPDEAAAGILYMPSKRDTSDKGMAQNGLIRSEIEIVSAMEKQMAGEFVPKPGPRSSSFADAEDFSSIFDYIEKIIKRTGERILSGDIAVSPLDGRETPACKYCDYAAVCGRENSPCERVPALNNKETVEKMREGSQNGI